MDSCLLLKSITSQPRASSSLSSFPSLSQARSAPQLRAFVSAAIRLVTYLRSLSVPHTIRRHQYIDVARLSSTLNRYIRAMSGCQHSVISTSHWSPEKSVCPSCRTEPTGTRTDDAVAGLPQAVGMGWNGESRSGVRAFEGFPRTTRSGSGGCWIVDAGLAMSHKKTKRDETRSACRGGRAGVSTDFGMRMVMGRRGFCLIPSDEGDSK